MPLVLDGTLFNNEYWAGVSRIDALPLRASVERKFSMPIRIATKLCKGQHPRIFFGSHQIREHLTDHRYDPSHVENSKPDSLVIGYFQTPSYFADIEGELRNELDLSQLTWENQIVDLADALHDDSESVAIHVRRTDYIGNSDAEVCGANYYYRALEEMRSYLSRPTFHIFSDDPEWCVENFSCPDMVVHTDSASISDPLLDLYLMSKARHHIIANSSYSWWAAWMGKAPGQTVITPSEWFRGDFLAPISEKLLEGWKALPTG